MTGRIDSTPDCRTGPRSDGAPLRVARPAAILAIAALVALAGLSATPPTTLAQGQAQAPAAKKSKAQPKAVEPDAMPDPGASADQPPPGMPPPGSMAFPTSPAREPRDVSPSPILRAPPVRPAQLAAAGPALPGATEPPGGAAPTAGGAPGSSDPFALPAERMGVGKQKVQLSVEVQASPKINLGKESTVKLVVKNESNVDASGVSLVYQLPEGLKINSSTPPATQLPGTSLYHWPKPMLAAASEWTVVLKVVATSTRPCEHAATVTAKAGSRANTIVQEPKLKVEATSSPSRVLNGEQVNFQVSVRNPGTGPARNVTVQAKLSSGLRSLTGDGLVEQTIAEIGPGQAVDLDPLTVDTVAGGQQTCTVEVRSPDVTTVPDDQRVTRNVEVTRPALVVKLEGQGERFTGQTNEYKLTVTNTGTAPARKVKVVASLPQQGGKLVSKPQNARYDQPTKKLIWSIPQLEPQQAVEYSFVYGTSTVGLYEATAEATSGELRASGTLKTDVSGIAVLDLQVSQEIRVMDVGKTNFYDITIKNSGTKEATRLQLSGKLTKNLNVLKPYNIEKGKFAFNIDTGEFIFPEVERLGVGQEIKLSLEVEATASGPAGCHVFLAHAEMPGDDGKVEDVVSTTITGNGRSKGSARP